MASGYILALNVGSSGLKFAAYEAAGPLKLLVRGDARGQESEPTRLGMFDGEGRALERTTLPPAPARDRVAQVLRSLGPHVEVRALAAVGHRIVHGGRDFSAPVVLDDENIAALDALASLAPLHQPAGLALVEALREAYPSLPQVACFDTAFHHGLAPPVSLYAVPRELEAEGVRRYGFHGISYRSIADQLAADPCVSRGERVIVAHLGNGASLCAMRDGRSVDTTMGFSVLDGLMMGTRPGAIDPGVLLYLLKEKGWSVERLERFLYHECGLRGVSGISADVAVLLASSDPDAAHALDLFAFGVARQTAALAGTLGGLDRFVFTGGIGEHAAPIREMIGDRLAWLGVRLDPQANETGRSDIADPACKVRVQVIPTDEERVIAVATMALVRTDSNDFGSAQARRL